MTFCTLVAKCIGKHFNDQKWTFSGVLTHCPFSQKCYRDDGYSAKSSWLYNPQCSEEKRRHQTPSWFTRTTLAEETIDMAFICAELCYINCWNVFQKGQGFQPFRQWRFDAIPCSAAFPLELETACFKRPSCEISGILSLLLARPSWPVASIDATGHWECCSWAIDQGTFGSIHQRPWQAKHITKTSFYQALERLLC